MNKVHVGTLAVSGYHQIRKFFNTNEKVKCNDHDFPLGYKLIPCGYMFLTNDIDELADKENSQLVPVTPESDIENGENFDEYACTLSEDDDDKIAGQVLDELIERVSNEDAGRKIDKLGRSHVDFKRTGLLVVCIRNAMLKKLTMEAHTNDLLSTLKAAVRDGKSFLTLIGDNGPDMDPKSYINAMYLGRIWRDLSFSRFSCVTYPAGRSTYNPIEHAWSPLSNKHTAVTISACLPGEEEPPCKQNLSSMEKEEKNKKMQQNAANKLAMYWQNISYDGNPVIPIPIEEEIGNFYRDHDAVEELMYASKRVLDQENKQLRNLRKEFVFFCRHSDRRSNCFSLMKCQLFKAKGKECDWCRRNPPKDCAALEFEKEIGGFFYDPIPSEKHADHFSTYFEMRKNGKKYERPNQDDGRCSLCPNWWFSSQTEIKRHRRIVHPSTKQKYMVTNENQTPKPTSSKTHFCHFKVNDTPCDQSFPTYHQLAKHKREQGHKVDRKRKANKHTTQEEMLEKSSCFTNFLGFGLRVCSVVP